MESNGYGTTCPDGSTALARDTPLLVDTVVVKGSRSSCVPDRTPEAGTNRINDG